MVQAQILLTFFQYISTAAYFTYSCLVHRNATICYEEMFDCRAIESWDLFCRNVSCLSQIMTVKKEPGKSSNIAAYSVAQSMQSMQFSQSLRDLAHSLIYVHVGHTLSQFKALFTFNASHWIASHSVWFYYFLTVYFYCIWTWKWLHNVTEM